MVVVTTLTRAQHSEPDTLDVQFHEINVTYPAKDITIAATILFPLQGHPTAGIVMVHGSEGISRKSSHYRSTALKFVSKGISVLIADKRGIGETTGEYLEAPDLHKVSEDIAASVEYLASRKEIRSDKVGLLAFSQGGWIAPLAALKTPFVSFMIIASGSGVSPRDQVIYQRGQELLDDGFPEQEVRGISEYRTVLWSYLGAGTVQGYEAASSALATARSRAWFGKMKFNESLPDPTKLAKKEYDYFRHLDFDPAAAWRNVSCPTLALFGEKDRHVPVHASVEALTMAFEGKSGLLQVKVFPGAGHPLRLVKGEKEMLRSRGHSPDNYGEQPSDYWPTIFGWLHSRGIPQ